MGIEMKRNTPGLWCALCVALLLCLLQVSKIEGQTLMRWQDERRFEATQVGSAGTLSLILNKLVVTTPDKVRTFNIYPNANYTGPPSTPMEIQNSVVSLREISIQGCSSSYIYNGSPHIMTSEENGEGGIFLFDQPFNSTRFVYTHSSSYSIYGVTVNPTPNNSSLYISKADGTVSQYAYPPNSISTSILDWNNLGCERIRVLIGCNHDLYFVCISGRVLHLKEGSTDVDFRIGSVTRPKGAVLNSDCSYLWVVSSDDKVIHKYKAPFDQNQEPVEVMNGTGVASLNRIPLDIALDTTSGRLWILLTGGTVIGGLITDAKANGSTPSATSNSPVLPNFTPSSIPSLYNNISCSSQNSTHCFVSEPVEVTSPFRSNFTVVFFSSALSFSSSSTLILGPNQIISSSGNVTIDGQLIIYILSSNSSSTSVLVIGSNSTRGSFSAIEVKSENGEQGCGYDTVQESTPQGLQVLITKIPCGEDAGDGISSGAIAGIVVGSLVGVCLLIALIAAIGVGIVAYKKKATSSGSIVF